MGMGNQGSSYEWGGQGIGGGVQGTQPLSIDTGLSNARSMPTTPATTPPGNSMQSMQPYQSQQGYDNSRPMYSSAPTQQNQYAPQQNIAQQNMARFGQPMQSNHYMKNEMGPPSSRAPGSGSESEHHSDSKADTYVAGQGNDQVGHGTGEEEAEHEHDTEYAPDNNAAYNATRGPYTYNPGPAVGSLPGEHPHLSPEMTGSPSHQNGSGRVTPRTGANGQPQWAPGYHTPPRAPPSSNLYSVMSDTRGSTNGNTSGENYSAPNMGIQMQPGYAAPALNGSSSNKRMRDDDDQDQTSRPSSRSDDIEGMKRRKTVREGSVGGPVGGAAFDRDVGRPVNRTRSTIVQRRR